MLQKAYIQIPGDMIRKKGRLAVYFCKKKCARNRAMPVIWPVRE